MVLLCMVNSNVAYSTYSFASYICSFCVVCSWVTCWRVKGLELHCSRFATCSFSFCPWETSPCWSVPQWPRREFGRHASLRRGRSLRKGNWSGLSTLPTKHGRSRKKRSAPRICVPSRPKNYGLSYEYKKETRQDCPMTIFSRACGPSRINQLFDVRSPMR